jgi:secondary thiamine-phosphate synthase enzyme
MRIAQDTMSLETSPREVKEITGELAHWVEKQSIKYGLLTVYIPHTSASLLIQENESPTVTDDIANFLRRLVPEDMSLYTHNFQGPDDMPAHIKSALTQVQLTIPIRSGAMQLSKWQGIFLLEHRGSVHQRSLILTMVGDDQSE